MTDKTFYGADEAAAALGVDGETIRFYCRRGMIGYRVLGRWRLTAEEVRALQAGTHPRDIKKAAKRGAA